MVGVAAVTGWGGLKRRCQTRGQKRRRALTRTAGAATWRSNMDTGSTWNTRRGFGLVAAQHPVEFLREGEGGGHRSNVGSSVTRKGGLKRAHAGTEAGGQNALKTRHHGTLERRGSRLQLDSGCRRTTARPVGTADALQSPGVRRPDSRGRNPRAGEGQTEKRKRGAVVRVEQLTSPEEENRTTTPKIQSCGHEGNAATRRLNKCQRAFTTPRTAFAWCERLACFLSSPCRHAGKAILLCFLH